MKLKYKFVIRQVGNQAVAVAVGKDNAQFNGMIKLNQSGEFIFRHLSNGNPTIEEITSALVQEYNVDLETARSTATQFIDDLKQNGLITE